MLRQWLLPAVGVLGLPMVAQATTEPAGAISDISVTVYRAPYGNSPSLNLDSLGGFALVTETRSVTIPAGESRLRFEGVADGIQPATAIITGLPRGVLEKNHDAKVLSPAELVTATLGKQVWLVRTNPKTGKTTRVSGSILADTDGVVFKSDTGLEALRCSGLPESFDFDRGLELGAKPTLSALVRSPTATTVTVRLSYLTTGFDWMANYVVLVAPGGKTMDLGAWVTLANSNTAAFPQAHTQVVAGRLNRESGEIEPVDAGAAIVANCWPRGTTSDLPEPLDMPLASPLGGQLVMVTAARRAKFEAAPMAMSMAVADMVQQEQLGDLKLYRVPERTSVASRQIKQVRLLDRRHIPIELFYRADLVADQQINSQLLSKVLRTRNDKAHGLDLPLPSGSVAAFYEHDGVPLLVHEAPLRDIALNEEVEIDAGEAADLRLAATVEQRRRNASTLKQLPLIPGALELRSVDIDASNRVEISNARNTPAAVELRLTLPDGVQLARADHVPVMRDGHQTFRLTVPAQGSATVRYQTVNTSVTAVPR